MRFEKFDIATLNDIILENGAPKVRDTASTRIFVSKVRLLIANIKMLGDSSAPTVPQKMKKLADECNSALALLERKLPELSALYSAFLSEFAAAQTPEVAVGTVSQIAEREKLLSALQVAIRQTRPFMCWEDYRGQGQGRPPSVPKTAAAELKKLLLDAWVEAQVAISNPVEKANAVVNDCLGGIGGPSTKPETLARKVSHIGPSSTVSK